MSRFLSCYATPLVLLALSAAVMALGEAGFEALSYQRDRITSGALWRLLSGHWVHLGWAHLLLNLAGLALVWALFGQVLAGLKSLALVLVISLGLSLSLLAFHPELAWYVGLSGVLHGLFASGAVIALHRPSLRLVAAIGLVLLAIKLTAEIWSDAAPVWVVTEAHFHGALWGIVAGLLWEQPWLRRGRGKSQL